MSLQPEIQTGQIWREVDPRHTRFVLVYGVGRDISIRTAIKIDGQWRDAPRSRVSLADPERFDGKRGGYAFVEAPLKQQ